MTQSRIFSPVSKLIVLQRYRFVSLKAIILLLLIGANSVFAATMTRSPINCIATGPGTNWNNAARAETSNDSHATTTVDGSTSEYLQCTNYAFSIPVGAVINGIIVTVERRASNTNGGGSRDAAMRIVQGGTIGTADRSTSTIYPATDTEEAHGGAADLWGLSWTPADINAANFGAALRVTKPSGSGASHTIRVDHIEITVDYTLDTTPPAITGINPYCGGTNQLVISLSELLDTVSAQIASNYVLSGGVSVTSATLQADGMSVLLRTSAMPAGGYTLTMSGVSDLAGNPVAAVPQAVTVNGVLASGVKGAYYTGISDLFPGTSAERIDSTINFNWGGGSPGVAGIPADLFSVRWTGYVLAPATGSYVLRTNSDDGVRLYLDGLSLIDNWTDHAATINNSPAVTLNAGQYYALQMDYYENGGQAVAQLSGDYNNTGFQIVPAGYFYYCQAQVTVPPGGFNAFETSTAANSTTGPITTKVSATAFSLDLVALNTAAPPAIQASFAGDVKVEVLGNMATNIALDGNNCPQSFTLLGGATATFETADQGRKANVTFATTSYPEIANAWRDARVRISYPATGTATLISCSTDNFAIRPANFVNVLVTDQNWSTAGAARSLNNTNVAEGNVHKAGRPFSVSAEARNSVGAVTTNYNGAPSLGAVSCKGSGSGCTTSVGTVSAASWTAASGVVSTGTATYSEVGTFGLQVHDTTFAEVDNADGTTPVQRNVPVSATVPAGRFVPDHFDVTVDAGITPVFKTFNDTACVSRTFTYIGQPFGYLTAPRAIITARNAAGAATSNYQGAWWKISGADVQQTYSSVSGTISGVTLNTPSVVANSNNTGTGTITMYAGDLIRFSRNLAAPQSAFNANIVLNVAASDASETSGTITSTTPAVFNGGGSGIAFDSGNEFRYGILKLSNAHGSELTSLPVATEVQYWNGGNFVLNAADHCTSLVASNVSLTNFQKNLTACETSASIGGRFASGKGNLVMSKPGAGNSGSADLRINLDGASGNACVAGVSVGATTANKDYLRTKSGGMYTADPSARASFGMRNSGPIIYIRETY